MLIDNETRLDATFICWSHIQMIYAKGVHKKLAWKHRKSKYIWMGNQNLKLDLS